VDPKDLIVRQVMPVDLRATAELLVNANKSRGRTSDAGEVRNAVQQVLEDSQRVLVIGAYHENQPGFAHGKMVGVLVMNVLTSVEHAGQVGWIETLFVKPDYRRCGLGERMLKQTLDWSDTRGLRALDLELGGEGHEPAAAEHLYQKHGFRPIQSSRLTRARSRS
jgi:GNAT superfamily N-acetyltransferase